MFYFSRTLKHGHQLVRTAREILHRKRDLLSSEDLARYEEGIERLNQAVKARDKQKTETESKALEELFHPIAPPADGLRDWTETIVVSIAVVVAFRAYFLQPFAIPTGSMQPTLNGLIVHKIAKDQPLPSAPLRILKRALFGHAYVDLVSPRRDKVVGLTETSNGGFFARTTIHWESGDRTTIGVPARQAEGFGIVRGRIYNEGDVIARGYVQAGDQVFVNRMSYHFRRPERGEVFVFRTEGIAGIGGGQAELSNPNRGEHYIKRLAGVPGDTLRIASPRLFLNGAEAKEPGLVLVAKAEPPYAGYGNLLSANLLRTTSDSYECGPKDYFALGDNSYNSSDSRFWGPVPEQNLLGTGYFVYWPLGPHWGFIK
ncbi:MAG: signal peptidase I [Verrucomicrobia bacterium]|nr:signal peptidase I [Verrucomicrobiota bacterium]